ncbi:HNH endonuclease [Sporosarcina aquimarina]|uniref:HNH endonuclease n=1 Tax=Sporosarcina aquimarina TaxID=114975 RepID=A0ABU4G447_9BACL|nr:HNH endonuclease [Sporosarcina aquimarina]MDW0111130.1 HNH endonuclease [Sporosarcina aquimarina]
MTYYIKRLGHQELGSILKLGDKPARGRYIYISKDEAILTFFPHLSTLVKNDSSLLPLIPLYLPRLEKVYCNYIYHNDKFHGSTSSRPRNEYRIYSNNSLEMNRYLFEANDIIIIKKDKLITDGVTQLVYYIDLVKDKTSALYSNCMNIIEKSPIRGDHALYDGFLEQFESKVRTLTSDHELEVTIDPSVTKVIAKSETNLESLFTSSSFRDFVMVGYESKCAVTGSVIKYNNFSNLEAAHIRPKSHGGTFLPSNGLSLSRDIHWAFDKGFFTLNDDYTILVHEEIESKFLNGLSGKSITLPENPFIKPDLNSIRYHRNNVFGLFITSGRL